MSNKKINEVPGGDETLTNDDILLGMDSPDINGVTKKISVEALSDYILNIEKSIFDLGIFYNETRTIPIDYDINKTVQQIGLIEGNYTFTLGSGWPIDKSVQILLEITVSDNVTINWDIIDEWYFNFNELINPQSGKYKLFLQKIGSVVGAYNLSKKTNNFVYSLSKINSAHGDETQTWGNSTKNVSTVGSNGGPSAYGTYDQSGNIWEWTDEQGNNETRKVLRGGQTNASWKLDSSDRSPTGGLAWLHIGRGDSGPGVAAFQRGFRIASTASSLLDDNSDSYLTTVGDQNNIANSSGYGSVNYRYKIGKYPITNCQYVEFLNSIAKGGEDPNNPGQGKFIPPNVYLDIMSDENEIWGGGINRETVFENGSSVPSYTYTVKNNYGDKPVINISWFAAARYCNWKHNISTVGPVPYTNLTENGAYNLENLGSVGDIPPNKEPDAKYWIPSADEWFKAAYYMGGGLNSGYWKYATQSNELPQFVNITSEGKGTLNGVNPVNFTNFECDLPENLLFDIHRILNDLDFVTPEPWKSRIVKAANRWYKFIKFSSASRNFLQEAVPGWNGIQIKRLEIYSNNDGIYASAAPNTHARVGSKGFQTATGELWINTFYESAITDGLWEDVIAHELGHILGIHPDSWGQFIDDNLLNGSIYINARNAYRQILNNNTLDFISLDSRGGSVTANAHWANYTRFQPAPLINHYTGLVNELMIGSFSQNVFNSVGGYVISPLTIKALVDMRYEEHSPGNSEGSPILVNDDFSAQNLDLSDAIQLNCCCNNLINPRKENKS